MKKTKEIQGIKAVKEMNGITLISLAVTIVVLLILAGVSINAIVGDNGIIKKAQKSAELSKEAEAKEIINRAVLEFRLSKGYETLKDFLQTKIENGTIDSVEENTDGTLKIWKNGYFVDNVENKTNSSKGDGGNSGGNTGDVENKIINLSATPYNGTYDGNSHDVITSISVEPSDAKIEYSTDETNFSTTMPTITNASSVSVTIRASKTGYTTKTINVIATVKSNEFTEESGVGYYADVDDDGTVDGIIFADMKKGASGSWGGQSYSISTVSNTKNYYISQENYSGPFGTKKVLATKETSGNERFYVMTLSDYNNGTTYKFTDAKSIKTEDWNLPDMYMWAAFGGELEITTLNYSDCGLSSTYWSSSAHDNVDGYYANFSSGKINFTIISGKFPVRLTRTF